MPDPTRVGRSDRSTLPREHRLNAVNLLCPERCEHDGCEAIADFEVRCSEWVGGRYREDENYRFPCHYYCRDHLPEDAVQLAKEADLW
jgi:hypothetical protein